ncbi:hypothetical protein SBOR_8210 [Sclerotinia borealis F-4128]|uniref:Uncharacterized protein n=1 Tax=Sclerotinia borealis (strain F-4128) TaxID=1432307 RepID=W9C6B6_SCLBF|nr:hypothetical protein SBOR_8210 [Sclerotinia borealis F-4128]
METPQSSPAPKLSQHPDHACPPRRISPCFRMENPDGSYTYLRVCEDSAFEDETPRIRVPSTIPNDIQNLDSGLPSYNWTPRDDQSPIGLYEFRDDRHTGQNDKGKSVPSPPPSSSSDNLNSPMEKEINDIPISDINLVADELHERINSLEEDIAELVNLTAYCLCSCHGLIPGRPVTPQLENIRQRSQPRSFSNPKNDRDERGGPGPSTSVLEERTRGVEDSLRRIALSLRGLDLSDNRNFHTLLERNEDLGRRL